MMQLHANSIDFLKDWVENKKDKNENKKSMCAASLFDQLDNKPN